MSCEEANGAYEHYDYIDDCPKYKRRKSACRAKNHIICKLKQNTCKLINKQTYNNQEREAEYPGETEHLISVYTIVPGKGCKNYKQNEQEQREQNPVEHCLAVLLACKTKRGCILNKFEQIEQRAVFRICR